MVYQEGRRMSVRVLSIVPVLFVASILIFVAMRVVPGDPVTVLAEGSPLSVEQRQALSHRYHLDQPIVAQYALWIANAAHGDLGLSLKSNRPVSQILGESLPHTLLLLLGGFLVSLIISVPLGIFAALREGRWADQAIISLTMLLLSIPLFISCVLAIFLFAFQLGVLPSFGTGEEAGIGSIVIHMLLPWTTLGLALVAVQTATLRAGLVDVLRQEYIVMAQSRGLPWGQVVRRHALRSALVPVVTLLGLQLSYMIVGSVFVDYIFGLGGLGTVLINSVNFRDLPVVQGAVMVVATFFALANLGVDLLASRLDPRYAIR
jgi:peptide/nickel transport system permease protein